MYPVGSGRELSVIDAACDSRQRYRQCVVIVVVIVVASREKRKEAVMTP